MSREESGKTKEKSSVKRRVFFMVAIILSVFLTAVIAVNLILIIGGITGESDKIPNIMGYYPLMVKSGSMSGEIETGDPIILKTVPDPSVLKERDIVAFWENEPGKTIITHRIIEVTEDDNGKLAFVTQGDVNVISDGVVSAESIVGIYKKRVPVVGDIAMFMRTVPGLIVCVVIPMSFLVGYDMLRNRNLKKSSDREKEELLAELKRLKAEAEIDSDTKE